MADTEHGSGKVNPDNSDDMEIVNDFSDLDLEIVSNTAPPQAADDGPSIDDFQFESSTPATPAKRERPRDEWYTRVLGQELGPFPFEQLIEMVIDKEIGPDDYLRHGKDSPWIAAGEIDGLIPEEVESVDEDDDDDDFELGPQTQVDDDLPQPKAASGPVSFQAYGGQINRAQDARPRTTPPAAPPVVNAQAADASAAAPAPQAEPAAAEAAPEAPRKPSKEEREAARKAEVAARLNNWLADKVEADDPIPVEENDEEAFSGHEPPGAGAAAAGGNPYGGPAAGNPYGGPAAGSPYGGSPYGGSPYGGGAAGNRAAPVIKKSKGGGGGSMFSGLGSLFSSISMPDASSVNPKALVALGAIGLVFGLMYLPGLLGGTNDQAIYERFKAIYSQIENGRANDPGALSSTKQALIDEVKQTVDDLEKAGAGADKPIKQQLFWAGRNCLLPLLQNPGTGDSTYDERFKNHVNTAGRMLGDPSVPPVQIETSEGEE
ncbi:DUF4339 domain-containing protein [Rubinisphaera sp. JC750]|uniref:DUF4339 domain-containing protein n=1 Tax=Rubinisphaera sp. JC750 TaxID=2898658 RepID=UPI001F40FF6E|nr:DUF4339 domain-containing protein [Rubinisphaera sp. JC750]